MDRLDDIRSISRLAGGLYYLSALADRVNRHPNPTVNTWVSELQATAGAIADEIKRMSENAETPTPAAVNADAPHTEGGLIR